MAIEWSKQQKQAVTIRNRRVLVSAAAGSGKTAVLVGRIIARILEEENPIEVNELLVMTFTRAAASQMKERIAKALEEELAKCDFGSTKYLRLKKQITMLECANISTIDSFCHTVIKENTEKTDLDPNFGIADEETLGLMRADILEQLMEEEYERGEESFLYLVDCFATAKTDAKITELIQKIYFYSRAMPHPKVWLDEQRRDRKEVWMAYLQEEILRSAADIEAAMDLAIKVCQETGGPLTYLDTFLSEKALVQNLRRSQNYEELCHALQSFDFPMIKRAPKGVDEELKNFAKGIRDGYKKSIQERWKKFIATEQSLLEEESNSQKIIAELIRLTEKFSELYSEQKMERNLVDFNDLEHLALDLLLEHTEIADVYRKRFKEIYIDEYQDSNLVQEELVHAIENQNVFMVGDVKQSIYGFRQARPELFIQKYYSFAGAQEAGLSEEFPDIRIDLSTNYRSRERVLDGVNALFSRIMKRELGGIEYDDAAALHAGASFRDISDADGQTAKKTQLLLLDTQMDAAEIEEEKTVWEAKLVAQKIHELMKTRLVQGEDGEYRKLCYRDIVILLRAQKEKAEVFMQVLLDQGIPAYAQTQSGYFTTFEVKKILSMLAAVDNPYKDIDFAAFLLSPIGKMTEADLAGIMAVYQTQELSGKAIRLLDACHFYLQNRSAFAEAGIQEKLNTAMAILERYTILAKHLPISELLYRIYRETGFFDYACAMPGGDVRKGNLLMLMDKAKSFTGAGYSGLFNFVRYIEELKRYDTDYGEASDIGEFEDTVRIMTIHKSKGLEFPVCFLCDAGKKFNFTDTKSSIVLDDRLGIGCDYVDPELRIKAKTLKKRIIAHKKINDALAEELRMLYVAMTRAKEELIITAQVQDLEKKLEGFDRRDADALTYSEIRKANSFLDWIMICRSGLSSSFDISCLSIRDLLEEELAENMEKEDEIGIKMEEIFHAKEDASFQSLMEFSYPHQEDTGLYAKRSVSELKRIYFDESESMAMLPGVGDGMSGENKSSADRGNAYHRVMELLDFSRSESIDKIQEQIQGLLQRKMIHASDADFIQTEHIFAFLNSELGKKMAEAHMRGELRREAQFIMGIPARELNMGNSEELVLIQGVIDAYIETDEGIILVDYKTDYMQSPQVLSDRYHIQLQYYAQALEKISQKQVKEKWIWSFALGQAIPC